ncbi:MAG: MFS transporter [Porticoccaceae bacterium]|nr:MFS transporter [Porticoccaceae bacterium]
MPVPDRPPTGSPVPAAIPHARLSAFYFWYYGLLGLLHPFWPIFLSHQRFSASEIGQLLAIQMATRLLAPNLWGWIADRSGRRMATIRVGAALGMVFFAGIFVADGFWSMALVMAGYSFFWNAVMPQFEALTLDHLQGEPERYSAIRVWGSVGFIITVVAGGYWFDGAVEDFRYLGLGFLVMIWLASLWVPAVPRRFVRPRGGDLWRVLGQRPVRAFLLVSFLLQMAHGVYYGFFSLQLEAAGYSRGMIGLFWALSVLAEIVLFVVMRRLLTRWSLRQILVASLVLTALRWALIGHGSGWLPALLFAQCLHALSFGACHAVSVEYLRRYFPRELLGQGQALYSAASFGAGGALGALFGGLMWGISPSGTFDAAVLVTLLAALVAFRYLPTPRDDGRDSAAS